MNRGFLAALAAAVLACSNGPREDAASSDALPERRAPEERIVVEPGWDTVFVRGGTTDDPLLVNPSRLAADAGGVSVVDSHEGRVVRFDRGGALVWSFGRKGRGPMEFENPRGVALDATGRTWVLDVANARVTVIGADGGHERDIPLGTLGSMFHAALPLDADRALVLGLDAARPITTVGPDGTIGDRLPFPWPGFERMNPLAAQMVAASHAPSGTWAAAFSVQDGFTVFDGLRTRARALYVEPIPDAVVTTHSSSSAGQTVVERRLLPPVFAAESIALSDDRLYVLFHGATPDRNRIVDVYAIEDGGYIETIRLPRRVSQIAFAEGTLYVLYTDPWPALAAWRPRAGAAE